MKKTIFITGATGNIGGKLAARIIEKEFDTRLVLLVRGEDILQAEQRVLHTLHVLSPELDLSAAKKRIEVVLGDISTPGFGLSSAQLNRLIENVTHIIHCAASTQFQLPIECARQTNVVGTANILRFAQRARLSGRMQGVAHVSTAYVCGDRDGIIYEDERCPVCKFANSYEQSKWETEQMIGHTAAGLPLTVFRPSIVMGDSHSGRTTAFNVLYTPLRFIQQGMLTTLPCAPDTPLDVVPLDYVCDAIHHIFLRTRNWPGKTYHLVSGEHNSPTVADIVDGAVDYFNRINAAGSLSPVHFGKCALIGSAIAARGRVRRMLELIRVFEPYIGAHRLFNDRNTQRALLGSGISVPWFGDYLERLLNYCLQTNWGRQVRRAA